MIYEDGGEVEEERKRKDKEEDVCFVCKDGGDLIMCDRWTCPKVSPPTIYYNEYS